MTFLKSKFGFVKQDLPAGIVVFLLAVPLCQGISLASGAPIISGIIAGIVGGMVVSLLSESRFSVSGPAAGLTLLILSSIHQLGSYEKFLMTVVWCGFFQLIFGFLKFGRISAYISNSVIKGMMAAIGLVIILKQFPHALGWDKIYDGDESFFNQITQETTYSAIVNAVTHWNGAALAVTLVCGSVMLLWEWAKVRKLKFPNYLPGAFVTVVVGVAINGFLSKFMPEYVLTARDGHLVQLGLEDKILSNLHFPDFSVIYHSKIILIGLSIAIIASLESLVALEAIDNLDKEKRISSGSRELFAQGIGNLISGLVGGLPITSVVVRSSVNIYAGARTRFASFIHGALILLTILLIPGLFNYVPLASLAAILMVVGYRLVSWKIIREISQGKISQWLPFFCTLLGVVFADMLVGIGLGMLCSVYFVIKNNQHDAFTLVNSERQYLLRANKDLSFINKSELKEKLRSIPDRSSIIIDGSRSLYVDQDIEELLLVFGEAAPLRNIQIEFKNILKSRTS